MKEFDITTTVKTSKKLRLKKHPKSNSLTSRHGDQKKPDYNIVPCSFLSEHLSLGLIIYNLKNNTLHANPASEEILGLSSELMQEQLDGFNLYKNGPKNHKNSPPGIVSIVTLLTKDENINSVLKVYNVARKMHIWVDINTVPFHHTSSDDFDNVLIIIKDVTEIVKAEDNLKRSEKRYRDVIDNCGEGIAVLQDGYLIFVNPKGCEISGYSEKELSGQPLVDIIYSEDRERINRITSEVLQNHKSPLPVQFRFINKLDEIRWCECISVFINWDNKPATLNFFRDITRRKLAEIALQESEEKYRTFIENYHGIAFTGDLFFNINSIYGSVKEITGYEPESFITNQPGWSEIILRTDLPAIEEDNNLLISKAKYSTRRTYRIVRRDGKVRWVNEHIKNICDDTDKPQMVEGFIEDITDIKKVEELEYRIKFERLITLISSDFIKIDMADIDFEINKALGVIGQFAEADRSYVFLFKDDLRHLENTHEWCREGVSPQIDNCRDIDSELIPWWMNKLKNKENILIGCINDLPWTADSEKEILQAQDIQSLLAVPMYMGKELIGFLGFDSVNEIRYWSEDTITLLTMAGTIFTNALERKKGDKKLRKINDELERHVHERTLELTKTNRELEAEREALQQKNFALKEILNQIEDEKKNMAKQIQLNIDRVALPIFNILEERIPTTERHYISLLKNCVSELSSPFISCLETKYTKLTPRETEICQMIKNGFSSKQIAKSFNNSLLTILKQRKVIRKKLKIAHKKINLASYLKSLK